MFGQGSQQRPAGKHRVFTAQLYPRVTTPVYRSGPHGVWYHGPVKKGSHSPALTPSCDEQVAPEGAPVAPTLGLVLRALFQAGASDEVITRFVPLYQNLTGGQPQPLAVDLGPVITQAAHSAGVAVAQGLLSQMGAPAASAERSVPLPVSRRQTAPAKITAAREDVLRENLSVDALVHGQIYRFNIAGRRTSVSLPPDLLESAKAVFGEAGLKETVKTLYGQVPLRNANRSAFVRDRLREQMTKVMVSAVAPHEQGVLH